MEKARILIVDNDPVVAESLRTRLDSWGYEITDAVGTGNDALGAVNRKRPDIALMDIDLGSGISGIETAVQLKEKFNVPVIYLTSQTDSDTISRAKQTEPYGYLLKPVEENQLKPVLEIALHRLKSDHKVRASEELFKAVFPGYSSESSLSGISGSSSESASSLAMDFILSLILKKTSTIVGSK